MDWISDPQAWIALLTLTVLEIVLGVDNVIFISILSSRLQEDQRARARTLGLALALIGRVALLLSLSWVIGLKAPLFGLFGRDFSGRDIIMLAGGLFLLAKATHEIHASMEGGGAERAARSASFASVILQILVLDLVFSLDSVITAVGMADDVPVMIAAVIVSVLFMLWFSGPVSAFVEKHPTIKMLALSFLILIGVNLVADAMGQHIPKGYTYFAMAFSVGVEMLNIKLRKHGTTVHLHESVVEDPKR